MRLGRGKHITAFCLMATLLFLVGCDDAANKKAKNKLLRKKISASVPKTAQTKAPIKKTKTNSIKPAAVKKAEPASALAARMTPPKTASYDRYDPKNKVDPFVPLFQTEPDQKVVPKQKKKRRKPITPLEKIDLSQLRLTAVIRSPRGNKAMLEEASGKGYWIEKGTYIGRNGGRVIAILGDRIRIQEEIETILGEVKTRISEITLPKPSGDN